MCLTKKLNDLKCTSPRRQHLQKPKLSRRIIKSNKVNLNLYWSLFEVMSTNGEPITTFEVLHRD